MNNEVSTELTYKKLHVTIKQKKVKSEILVQQPVGLNEMIYDKISVQQLVALNITSVKQAVRLNNLKTN